LSACISDDVFVVGVLLFFLLVLRRVWLPVIVSLKSILVWLLLVVVVLSRPDWFIVGVVSVVLVPEERSAVSSWSWC